MIIGFSQLFTIRIALKLQAFYPQLSKPLTRNPKSFLSQTLILRCLENFKTD